MPITIGLDTSFVIGLLDEKDVWSVPASQLYEEFLARNFNVIAFDCVLAEAIGTLSRRVHEKRRTVDLKALLDRIKAKFPTKSIVWLYPTLPEQYENVIDLIEQSNGELNFNDALIALSCQQRNIEYLASFDADFDQVKWLKRIQRPADLPE